MLELLFACLVPVVVLGDSGSSNCGGFGVLTNPTGSFQSHGTFTGSNSYAPSKTCTWKLQAPAGQRVRLTFPDGIDIEDSSNCKADYIALYDGSTALATEYGTWCGSGSIGPFLSTGTSIFIKFYADATVHGFGFRATYEFIPSSSVQSCSSLQFTCMADKSCIPKAWLCDGEEDCHDGSDEEACTGTTKSPVVTTTKATQATAKPTIPSAAQLNTWTGGCGQAAVPYKPGNARIVGGVEATPSSWPWQAMVRYNSGFVCGGTLVAQQWVLTAAHCMDDASVSPSAWTVVLGKHSKNKADAGEMLVRVSKVIIHPQYDIQENDNDIALFKLVTNVTYNDKIRPACLPAADAATGKLCYVSGWGATQGTGSASVLKQAAIPIVSRTTCTQQLDGVTNNMICAGYDLGGHDSCSGDSGGPLVCPNNGNFELQGVVSWGDSAGCAGQKSPGVYSRVVNYIKWIGDTMAKN